MEPQEKECLIRLFQNADMGTETIHKLLPRTGDPKLKNRLETQLSRYRIISEKIARTLWESGARPKDNPFWTKAMADMGIELNTFADHSSSKIAELLIKGSTIGIIDLQKIQKEYPHPSPSVREITSDLGKLQEKTIEEMKHFIS
ncbi:MAG: hypothetical protein SOX72_07280 [Oscillospiraceae bacterium]|nr:hypothetical protein [Oscillospiraceae bacterium]MDY4191998.1 hypothetical protein [Oscillospiraceae bacterium]